jgi:hypothetical protein
MMAKILPRKHPNPNSNPNNGLKETVLRDKINYWLRRELLACAVEDMQVQSTIP